jgi:hypothetical protein
MAKRQATECSTGFARSGRPGGRRLTRCKASWTSAGMYSGQQWAKVGMTNKDARRSRTASTVDRPSTCRGR